VLVNGLPAEFAAKLANAEQELVHQLVEAFVS